MYTNAWLALERQPIILHVPPMQGRYYLIPMLDAYSNVFASIGSRTTGDQAGNYAIVGPQWHGDLPPGLSGVIKAPTNVVWLIGRTLVRGKDDLPAAVAVAQQYQLVPLSAYHEFVETGNYTPPANVPHLFPNTDFAAFPVYQSPGLYKPEFFDLLAFYALNNPPPLDQEPQASSLVLDGFNHQSQLTSDVVDKALAAFKARFSESLIIQNGWQKNPGLGNYGADYALRGAVALTGLGANIPQDSVYASTTVDLDGNALDGNSQYVIHFDKDQAPPVNGFWSVTAYDNAGLLVPNPIQRYSVSSESALVPNADGSVDILIQNSPPAAASNWLPVPQGPFNLTLRLYWPRQPILDGSWTIPTVTQIQPN